MLEILILLLILIIALILLALPFVIAYLILRFIKKRNYNQIWRITALLPIAIFSFYIYTAIYPLEEFYETDIKTVSGIELPKSSKFLFKTAGYPDHFGDYTSVSIICVDSNFYNELPIHLLNHDLIEQNLRIGCQEMDEANKQLGNLKILREFSKHERGLFLYIGLLSDFRTILVQRSRS